MRLNELPTEILQSIHLPRGAARQAVLVCRRWRSLFTPQLYQVMYFEKLDDRARSNVDLTIPEPEARIVEQRALHLWLHTICSSNILRRYVRAVYLMSDLTLTAEAITSPTGDITSCNGPWCASHDWAQTLGGLPSLEHLSLSPSWLIRFVGWRGILPKLRTVQSHLPPDTSDDFLVTQGTPPPVWETSHVLHLATQPGLRTLGITGGKMLGAVESTPGRPTSVVTTLSIDTVMIPGRTLGPLLRCFSQLQTLKWRRPPNTCLPGDQDCTCEETVTNDLSQALTVLSDNLTVLHLEFQTHGQHRWWPWRCPRDRHIIDSVHSLHSLKSLRIAVELLVGRRVCRKRARGRFFRHIPTQHLARKLPSQLEHLTAIVDIAYAIYEFDFRPNILHSIVGDQSRLSTLREVVILDRVGDAYNDDLCGSCAVHDPYPNPPSLEVDIRRCRSRGIDVTYQPCSDDQIRRVRELSGVASSGRSLWRAGTNPPASD